MAANGSGEVLRLDPQSGAVCVLVSGLRNPSAVKLGRGPGWSAQRLYVTSFDGSVKELTPPPGQEPATRPEDPQPGAGRPCRARRAFHMRLREVKGRERLVRARVSVDGRRVPVRRRGGRLLVRVTPGTRADGRTIVRVTARTSRGRIVRSAHRFRFCPRT
jgi:hypothetical protein